MFKKKNDILYLLAVLSCSSIIKSNKVITFLLDPAGSSDKPSRFIDDEFEKTLTLLCSKTLQRNIEEKYPSIRILLSRHNGKIHEDSETANLANRLQVECLIRIHFFQETKPKPRLYIYYYDAHEPINILKSHTISWFPHDKAYLASIQKTITYTQEITALMQTSTYTNIFSYQGVYGLPCISLLGIKQPALIIEIGLKEASDWKLYIELLEEIIISISRKI